MTLDPWRPIGDRRYLGTDTSAKYPIYTRGNAGEVFPEVQYPLSFTQSWELSRRAFQRSSTIGGVVTDADFVNEPNAFTGVFGGYTYLNLSTLRLMAARVPGVKVDIVDQQVLGSSSAPPYVRQKGDRKIRAALSALRYGLHNLKQTTLPQLDADEAKAREWIASLPALAAATNAELLDRCRGAQQFVADLFENHLVVSGGLAVPLGMMSQLCEKRLKDPSMLGRLIVGSGGIASAAPAAALWDLGRLVAASPAVTAQFDAGVSGLPTRLASDPAASAFCVAFDRFLDEHGCRGPNEWETACPTWGTDPELALALVDRMRGAADDHDPKRRHDALVHDREAAIAEAAKKLGPFGRRRLRRLIASTALYSQGRERAKTTVVRVIHGNRMLLRELGRRCAARCGGRPDDLWFVTAQELDAYVADPGRFAGVVAERRETRELLASREPPFIIDGVVPPFETWARRDAPTFDTVKIGQVLPGIGGCPGVARGRARVVLDPGDPRDIGPGDVLVAPLTDPSWTPLFVPVEAVVVDVGAMLSHAVIVSRELGIPAVVSVTGATKLIPDGALIEVNGTQGTVTILELP